jgi:hypothetical protein
MDVSIIQKKGKLVCGPQPSEPAHLEAHQRIGLDTASGHLLPRDNKLLSGALESARSAAASWTLEMKAAALRRL